MKPYGRRCRIQGGERLDLIGGGTPLQKKRERREARLEAQSVEQVEQDPYCAACEVLTKCSRHR